jgi:phosphoglycolate phosphatase
MPKLQGLIFDLDGTLVDSAPDLRHAINKTLIEQGRRGLALEELQSFLGDGMMTMLQRAFAATGPVLSEDEAYRLFQDFIAYYRGQKPDLGQIYPYVRETLDVFLQEGVKFGLCTNKQEASTLRLMDELELMHYFTFIAGGDTFPVHKPHPGHVKGVIEKLQVPAESCVMIGDSTNDVLAAKGAGIRSLVVTHGYGIDVGELGADGLIGGFNELHAALRGLGFL